MNCRSARDTILEADPAELEVPGDTELGRHLAVCPDCRAAAAAVLDRTATLRGALNELVATAPRRSVDSALAELRRPRPRPRPRPLPRLVPWAVAAAAILAAIILTRTPAAPPPMDRPTMALAAGAPRPVVEDAGGADIAVFDTRDRGITVVWIYQEEIR